jgi:photosystem II PsbW protein
LLFAAQNGSPPSLSLSPSLQTTPTPTTTNQSKQTVAVRPVASLKASVQRVVKQAAAAAAAAPALLAAHPAFALVDDRLNGDGTGLKFGVNNPAIGWAMAGAFATVWALYYVAQRDDTISTDLEGRNIIDDDDAGAQI